MTSTDALRIITSGAFAAALEKLLPLYRAQGGGPVELFYGSSLGEHVESIPSRLARGETFDVYFLAAAALERHMADGDIDPASRADLVESHIGAAVRAEDEAPDISTVEAFKRTLLESRSVAHAASASGIYLSQEIFPRLGIAEEMKPRTAKILGERVGRVVARGEADLGFQQISELLPIEGIKIIGRLPPELRKPFTFCAGIGTRTLKREAALGLLRYLASEEAAPTIRETGLDPLFPEIIAA